MNNLYLDTKEGIMKIRMESVIIAEKTDGKIHEEFIMSLIDFLMVLLICDKDQATLGIQEHRAIYEAIEVQDPKLAKAKMKIHFKILYQYCYNIK